MEEIEYIVERVEVELKEKLETESFEGIEEKIQELINFTVLGKSERDFIFQVCFQTVKSLFVKMKDRENEGRKEHLKEISCITRLFRNLLFQSKQVQTQILEEKLTEQFTTFTLNLFHKADKGKEEEEGALSSEEENFLKYFLQFCTNFVTDNETTCNYFFEHCLEGIGQVICSVQSKSLDPFKITCSLVHNLICKNWERRSLFLQNENYVKLFSHLMSKTTCFELEKQEKGFEWTFLLVKQLLHNKEDSLRKLMESFSLFPKKESELKDEQIDLMNVMTHFTENTKQVEGNFFSDSEENVFNLSNCKTLVFYFTETISFLSNSPKKQINSQFSEFGGKWLHFARLCLTCLLNLSSHPTQWNRACDFLSSFESVLFCSLHFLKSLWEERKKDTNKKFDTKGREEDAEQMPTFGMRRDLVGLIANLSFRNKKVQDLVREFDGIVLILNQCNLDSENPFIREWSLLALRNLCEDNVENQKVISSLKENEIPDNEFQKEMGVRLELKDGKINIKTRENN